MESIWVYILVGLFFVLRSYLENKNKKKSLPEPEESDIQEIDEEETVAELAREVLAEQSRKPSLSEEYLNVGANEEGSERVQHSSQYEMEGRVDQTNHDIHEDYSGKPVEADESPMVEMDAEKMKQALIYQTILQRPDF